jgi:hypothetical protein
MENLLSQPIVEGGFTCVLVALAKDKKAAQSEIMRL